MKHEGVDRLLFRLVGAAKAEEIRRDNAQAGGDKGGDHLAVEIGPGRLPMQAERDRRVARSLVEIVHAQAARAFEVMGGEGKGRQGGKALVGSAQSVHRSSPEKKLRS